MRPSNRLLVTALIAAVVLNVNPSSAAVADTALATAATPEPTVWQARQAGFDYFSLTSIYTCDGLESKVKQLLLYLGARKDLQVRSGACGPSGFPMGRIVRIDVDFQTLAPAADAASTPGVQGYWAPLQLSAGRPRFMESGDCELVEQMRHFLSDNFSLRNLDYAASCTPHDVFIDSFKVEGEVLRATRPNAG
jgi:hypothetical protein